MSQNMVKYSPNLASMDNFCLYYGVYVYSLVYGIWLYFCYSERAEREKQKQGTLVILIEACPSHKQLK